MSSPRSRASFQPQRRRRAFKVMHSLPQITQPSDKFQTRHPTGCEHIDSSYTVLAATCPISVLPVVPTSMDCSFRYTLPQKHRRHVYVHLRWHSTLYVSYVCIFGKQVHGTRYSFIAWPCNMYFAQIYILAEMSYGKTCPDLGTYICTIK